MAQIAVLDAATIDKIAAGEVVERPVNVVKELVENAVDAGATAITVEAEEGGVRLIRVTDNGGGIEADQVARAFLRHATSKIKSVEDLLHVTSLGFRGEALSSIAAVSRVELITKTSEQMMGIRYEIDGGNESGLEEIGAPDGTTVLVRNLFYNIPVRRKFLKSAATEGSYIAELMEHLALSRPDISFKFVVNHDTRFHTSGNGDLKEVIYRIYGRDVSENLIPVEVEENGIAVRGYLGKPELNRSNRNFETYFVNGRYIRSNVVSKAVEEAYKPFLMQHKYPFCVLSFTIAADEIDVNVHPTKLEIRFIRQSEFYDMTVKHIRAALSEKELIPDVLLDENAHRKEVEAERKSLVQEAPEPFETGRRRVSDFAYKASNDVPAEKEVSLAEESGRYDPDAFFFETGKHAVETQKSQTEKNDENTPKMQDFLQNDAKMKVLGAVSEGKSPQNGDIHANIIKQKDQILIENPIQMELFPEKLLTKEAQKEHRILGQIFDTYWLVAYREKLFIIDQHAAHEKVRYERLMAHLNNRTEIPSQRLEPPLILTLNASGRNVLAEYEERFAELGFEIESFGGSEMAVRAVPMDLYGCDEKRLLQEMLDELAEGPVKGTPEVIRAKLASMACKSAVKGNTRLSEAEAHELIEELLTLENPYHCPHGRPTIVSMSKYEMEKKFKRIVN